MRAYLYLCLVVIVSFISCTGSKKASRNIVLDPITVNASDNDYRATATMEWDITHTQVALSFDMIKKTADGEAWIDLNPYFYTTDSIRLDAKGMRIDKVLIDNKPVKYTYADDALHIQLDRPYHRSESIRLYVQYQAMPYMTSTGGSKAITDDRGLYFINTDYSIPGKPAQIWTQGETESNSHWVPTFDKPNERFTTQIELTVPDSFTTLSNGILANQHKYDNGTRTDIWEMHQAIQPYVMMFAIGKFSVREGPEWNGKKVNYYVEPDYADYADDIFGNTTEMIEFFSDITGIAYPWDKYSQVIVRDYVSGAMENTSATLFGEFMNQTGRELADKNNEDVISHELFHQWFGDYVTAESWSNITLNESFANYGEQLWRTHKYGKANASVLAYNDFQSYLNAKNNDAPLVRFFYKSREDVFDRISYQKGGHILHYLHGLMGDTAFYKAMNIYLSSNALQPAEATQWRLAIEKATGQDWNWFFNQWYYKGGHPKLEVSYKFDDASETATVTVTQKQERLYRLPLKTSLTYGAEQTITDWDIKNRTETFSYPYKAGRRPVIIPDVENWLVGELTDKKTNTEWIAHYLAAAQDNYIARLNALINCSKQNNVSETQKLYRLAIKDTLSAIRSQVLLNLLPTKNTMTQNEWKNEIVKITETDPSNDVRTIALSVLQEWEVKEALPVMYASLSSESYRVAGAALRGIAVLEKDTAYSLAQQVITTDPKSDLLNAAWQVICNEGAPADTTLLSRYVNVIYGRQKLNFAANLKTYLENTPSNDAFSNVLNNFEYLVLSENIKIYRLSLMSYLFDVAYFYKDEVKSTNTRATNDKATFRFNELKKVIRKIEQEEPEEDNLRNYRMYIRDLFGE